MCLTFEAPESFIMNLEITDHRTEAHGLNYYVSLQLRGGYSTTVVSSGALFMVELFLFTWTSATHDDIPFFACSLALK